MLRLLAVAMALAALAHAGDGKGNGGDGVRLPSGKIVLYDLFEKGIDIDKELGPVVPEEKKNWNRSIELELQRISFDNSDSGPLWKGDGTRAMIEGLTRLLDIYGGGHPLLVPSLLSELRPLRWAQASVDLIPNPDTKSALDPKKFEALGCARTELGTALYSPSCGGESMSPLNRAEFVIHEIFYLFYESFRGGDLDNSLPIRMFVTSPFVKGMSDPIADALQQIGMKDFLKQEDQVRQLFFGGKRNFSTQVECSFRDAWVKDFTLQFWGPARINGKINMREAGSEDDPLDQKIGGTTAGTEWVPLIPEFDLKRKRMRLELSNNNEERTLFLTIDYGGKKTVGARLTTNDESESYPFEFEGTCSRLF